MKNRLFVILVTVFFSCLNSAFAEDPVNLRFGVLSHRPKEITRAQWLPFTEELQKKLHGHPVELLPLNYDELDNAVREKEIDFILTNPEHYIQLKNRFGMNAVATLISLEKGHPMTQFAGVIFTRSDRIDIQTLEDLNGKTIASPAEGSLGGYLMQRWELEKNNVTAGHYDFVGMPHDNVVNKVLAGKADAGFVRSGVLENLERDGKITLDEKISPIRVLKARPTTNDLPLLHSTDHYPEWAFAVRAKMSPELARKVSIMLLNIKSDSDVAKVAGIAGFNPPSDYTSVEVLMLRLRAHPDELKYFDFSDVLWRYREFAAIAVAAGLLIITLIIFLIRVNRSFKKIALENKKLSLAVEQSPIAIVITDLNAGIEYVNPAFTQHTGYELHEVIGENPRILQSGKTEKHIFVQMWEDLTQGKSYRCEMVNRRKDGSEYVEMAVITPIKGIDGNISHYLAIKQDITERKQAIEMIQSAYRYARNLIETSLDPLVTISPEGKITDVNTATEKVTGVSRENLIGSDFADYFTDTKKARESYQKVFSQGFVTDYPLAIRHVSGKITDILYNASVYRDNDGEVLGVFAAARDITERKKAEDLIKQLAFYDPLTGLPNRRKLLDSLDYAILAGQRENRFFAVFMMDLDKFKPVNDSFGHAAGDELLKQVAVRIGKYLRDSDTVARLGGDEFVIILDRLRKIEDAEKVATKIIDELCVPFALSENLTVQIGTSIGISFYPQHGNTAEDLLNHADFALYKAKANGRGCFAHYEL